MSPDTALVPQPTLDEFPEFVSIPIRIARNAEVQLQVSHLIPRCDHKGSLRCVEVVDQARAR